MAARVLLSDLDAMMHSGGAENLDPEAQRYEDKYFFPADQMPELLECLLERLRPSYPTKDTQFYLIDSIYFDSDALSIFGSHFTSPRDRYKLRLRRYGPNGQWRQDKAFIELKTRKGRLASKTRLAITYRQYLRLLNDQQIDDLEEHSVRKANVGLEFNALIARDQLKATCRIVCLRQAFEAPGLRVTIDATPRFELLRPISPEVCRQMAVLAEPGKGMAERIKTAGQNILEVKYIGSEPEWLRRFLLKNGSSPVGFSKYCGAVGTCIFEDKPGVV